MSLKHALLNSSKENGGQYPRGHYPIEKWLQQQNLGANFKGMTKVVILEKL